MEPWPQVAWVLLLTLITDWSKSAQSRDFTVKDIVFLHPSTTPFPGGFKCFSCENAADNYNCNRWAPDVYCPRESRYCHTWHQMDERGATVSVTKRCAALQDCLSTGCSPLPHRGHQEAAEDTQEDKDHTHKTRSQTECLETNVLAAVAGDCGRKQMTNHEGCWQGNNGQ
ncbi:ly6/PLAUR domain-containing protein 6-like isoform X2 [Scleropages formosus]|nr:ly6/PLAUR domain-containing protein 6 isoform X2 [Scleropages formosus]